MTFWSCSWRCAAASVRAAAEVLVGILRRPATTARASPSSAAPRRLRALAETRSWCPVGYQARGTLGRRLLEGGREVVIEGRAVDVRARVTALAGFSAHADREGLLAWLAKVPGPPRRVFVCHGEKAAAEALANRVTERLGIAAEVPEEGRRSELWR